MIETLLSSPNHTAFSGPNNKNHTMSLFVMTVTIWQSNLAMQTPPSSSVIFPKKPPLTRQIPALTRGREEATLRWLSSDEVVVKFWGIRIFLGVPYWVCTTHAKNCGTSTPYHVGPPNEIAQLVNVTPISLWFMRRNNQQLYATIMFMGCTNQQTSPFWAPSCT